MIGLRAVLCLTLALFCSVAAAEKPRIDIHEDTCFRGRWVSITIPSTGCVDRNDVPGGWANIGASSINTHGDCVELYDNDSCEGDPPVILEPGSPSHYNLKDLKFNDKLESLQLCARSEPNFENVGGEPCETNLCRRKLQEWNPEYNFFDKFFTIVEASLNLRSTFRNLVRASQQSSDPRQRGYIDWTFFYRDYLDLPVSEPIPRGFAAYIGVLQNIAEAIERERNEASPNRIYLRNRAMEILHARKTDKNRGKGAKTKTAAYLNHEEAIKLWQRIVDALTAPGEHFNIEPNPFPGGFGPSSSKHGR